MYYLIKPLLVFFFFCISLFADNHLDISKTITKEDVTNTLYCTDDKNNSLDFEDILTSTNLQKISSSNLGYKYNNYWCRLSITNNSLKKVEKIFFNPRAGMDYLFVKIYQNDTIKTFELGDMVTPKNRSYHSNYSNFKVSLDPKQSATLVIDYRSVGPVELGWNILSFEEFIKHENSNNLFVLVFLGFVLAMFIYKFFIYVHIKDKEYLIYALMMGTIFISQFALNGVMHLYLFEYIDSFTITLINWVFVHAFLVLIWIFSYYFFNITKKSRFHYPLVFVIAYNIFITLLYGSSYFYIDVLKLTPLIAAVAFFESVFLLLFSGMMVYQKKAGSIFFFIGHLCYIVSVLVYVMLLQGKVPLTILTLHGVDIGLLCVSLLMSLALSRKFRKIKEENKKQKEQIEKNKQFTMIGATIGYVVHQWKQPLSILSSQTNNLLMQAEYEPNIKISQIKEKFFNMEKTVISINNTLDDIKSVFSLGQSKNATFDLKDIFEDMKENFATTLKEKNIVLKIDYDPIIELNGNKNLLLHALSNIVQNSIEHFSKDSIEPTITIDASFDITKNILISIKDNAGGIKVDPIEKIFEPNYTTKTFGSGIGLTFTKNIIESKFNGNILVKNTQNGALFEITI